MGERLRTSRGLVAFAAFGAGGGGGDNGGGGNNEDDGNDKSPALNSDPVWVMNVVPARKPSTLSVIYDRGLIGVYHDW